RRSRAPAVAAATGLRDPRLATGKRRHPLRRGAARIPTRPHAARGVRPCPPPPTGPLANPPNANCPPGAAKAVWPRGGGGPRDPGGGGEEWAGDFAAPALALLTDQPATLPAERSFRLLASSLNGAERHIELMTGTALAAGGTARREMPAADTDPDRIAEMERSLRERRTLIALSQPDWSKLADSGALLAQISPVLDKLPPDQGATAALNLAAQYARAGQWHLAREAYLLMVDRYPAHPAAADAYRWLAGYHSSSEARRREELGQFLVLTRSEVKPTGFNNSRDDPLKVGSDTNVEQATTEMIRDRQRIQLSNQAGARRWYQGALAVESRLAAFGPVFANDPALQFCLNASKRQLGDIETVRHWNRRFLSQQRGEADDPWRQNAAAELWLTERMGLPP